MTYVYITGLAHSGTTLLSHLLSGLDDVISIGEVSRFMSTYHMQKYKARWGHCEDFSLCSCGTDWKNCSFWGPRYNLCGLESEGTLLEKYERLLGSFTDTHLKSKLIVDTSKNISDFHTLRKAWFNSPGSQSKLALILVVKDLRSFLASMKARRVQDGMKTGLVADIRTLNLWHGKNRELLDTVAQLDSAVSCVVVTYEDICLRTKQVIACLCNKLETTYSEDPVSVSHSGSHIVMGNTDFIHRNRDSIKYDDRWFYDTSAQLAYLLHPKARALNNQLIACSQESLDGKWRAKPRQDCNPGQGLHLDG